jgi:hypothetical protein
MSLGVLTVRRLGRGLYGFDCPGCLNFTYERTTKEKAMGWAAEHNLRDHAGAYEVKEG